MCTLDFPLMPFSSFSIIHARWPVDFMYLRFCCFFVFYLQCFSTVSFFVSFKHQIVFCIWISLKCNPQLLDYHCIFCGCDIFTHFLSFSFIFLHFHRFKVDLKDFTIFHSANQIPCLCFFFVCSAKWHAACDTWKILCIHACISHKIDHSTNSFLSQKLVDSIFENVKSLKQ